jgi:hypothetical protein
LKQAFAGLSVSRRRVSMLQVCEEYFRRESGAMGALQRLLAWAASVVQYRSLALCRSMGILIGLVTPGMNHYLVCS